MTMTAYKDGIVYIKKELDFKTDFSLEPRLESEYETICKLRYALTGIRVEDEEFISARGHTLSLKIKVPLCTVKNISEYSAFIEEEEFSIIYTDIDKEKKERYLYLEKVGIGHD